MYQRFIKKSIENILFKGKIIILYGPRQSGKTTLVKVVLSKFGQDGAYFNCEVDSVKKELSVSEPSRIKSFFGTKKIIVLDEAQSIENIGRILKTFVDAYPTQQIIATGSSSFDLANKINEPLTGRSIEFLLLPLSYGEIIQKDGLPSLKSNEETIFRFGLYPGIYSNRESQEMARRELENIQTHYLYKDILALEDIRKPKLLEDLLRLLAFQIGNEVSLNELAVKLAVSIPTVERYLDLLEKTFIIKRLYALSRNLRNEIRRGFKAYFIDIGIRNSLIQNFNPLSLRDDIGGLFENLFIIERIKKALYEGEFKNYYFWRTYDQKEIDFIEEFGGAFSVFECKYTSGRISNATQKMFLAAYPRSTLQLATKENYIDIVT
ncbi:ATP-binding protein [Candidatus Uhrbacteria bacterium]|nr:ATP-binding protein [Candidatus Uhrbacteria bacterium]